jgi:hypothetical protein
MSDRSEHVQGGICGERSLCRHGADIRSRCEEEPTCVLEARSAAGEVPLPDLRDELIAPGAKIDPIQVEPVLTSTITM